MREILFRGKRKDNGEWATATSIFKEGCDCELHFYINSLSDVTVYFNSDGNITGTETELDCEWLEVIQETVGQFTGLTDKNGKKIFEGDILETEDRIVVVTWHSESACWDSNFVRYTDGERWTGILANQWSRWASVIGNIHDNPELIENEHSEILR